MLKNVKDGGKELESNVGSLIFICGRLDGAKLVVCEESRWTRYFARYEFQKFPIGCGKKCTHFKLTIKTLTLEGQLSLQSFNLSNHTLP